MGKSDGGNGKFGVDGSAGRGLNHGCMSSGERTGRSWFLVGIAVGAVLGGSAAAISFKCFTPKLVIADSYEFLNLSHGAAFDALRVNKRTGESWGLRSDGQWLKITDWQSVDDWLKSQNYTPDSNDHWTLKTN